MGALERPAEAAWISAVIERYGGIAPPSLVEEVLDLHQAYLRDPRLARTPLAVTDAPFTDAPFPDAAAACLRLPAGRGSWLPAGRGAGQMAPVGTRPWRLASGAWLHGAWLRGAWLRGAWLRARASGASRLAPGASGLAPGASGLAPGASRSPTAAPGASTSGRSGDHGESAARLIAAPQPGRCSTVGHRAHVTATPMTLPTR